MRALLRPMVLMLAISFWPMAARAGGAQPVFAADFETSCISGQDWRISSQLDSAVHSSRIRCVETAGGQHALGVTVRPGDGYDPHPGSIPTERAEVQLRHEVVRFDAATWYSFSFRIDGDWPSRRNRTVIQQIKQNIDPRYEKGRGGEEICDAANPLFKIEVDSDGMKPVFRAKVAGTQGCGDSVGQQRFCGDWSVEPGRWHRVNVLIRPSQAEGDSLLRLWLDGRACPVYRGLLGYPRYGVTRQGKPVIDTQPRFGIYRDALPGTAQTILFDDILFWNESPAGHPAWAGIDPALQR